MIKDEEPAIIKHNQGYDQQPCDSCSKTTNHDDEKMIVDGVMHKIETEPAKEDYFSKLEKQLDMVVISDSEEEMQLEEYQLESAKVAKLYNDEGEEIGSYLPTKNEILNPNVIPAIPELQQNSKTCMLGHIESLIEDSILIKSTATKVINLDSVVFNSKLQPIGYIIDLIGQIEEPYYIAKFFPNQESNVSNNEIVYYDEINTTYINTIELLNKPRGTDASNAFDEEIPSSEEECSDDEIEQSKKRQKKQQKNFKEDNIPIKKIEKTNQPQPQAQQYNYNKSNIMIQPSQLDPFAAINSFYSNK